MPRGVEPGQSCGFSGPVAGEYAAKRCHTGRNSSALWVEFTIRSQVWQLVQPTRNAFCFGVLGTLIAHSPVLNWDARFFVFTSVRSVAAVLPAAMSALLRPSRSKPTARMERA